MKGLLLSRIILLSSISIIAQDTEINFDQLADSMEFSSNPGKYWLDALQPLSTMLLNDQEEAHGMNELRRQYGFWRDRIASGDGVLKPFEVYNNSLINAATESICTPPSGTFNGNWKNIGPQLEAKPSTTPPWLNSLQAQGRIYAVWVDPNDDQTILAGAVSGLWKTINGGRSWVCITDGVLSNGSIGVSSIAVNPFNSQEIFISTSVPQRYEITNVGGYGQGIWRTTNGGISWTQQTLGTSTNIGIGKLKFCPHQVNTNQSMIIASNDNKLFQKIGNGSWVEFTPTVGWTSLRIHDIVFTDQAIGKFYVTNRFVHPNLNAALFEFNYNTSTGIANNTCITVADRYFTGTGLDFGHVANLLSTSSSCSSSVSLAVNNQVLVYRIAYAGNGKLYALVISYLIMNPFPTCTANNTLNTNKVNVMEYDIATNTWQTLFKNLPNTNDHTDTQLEIVASPLNPDVIYIGLQRPVRLSKNSSGVWVNSYLAPYGWGTHQIHADVRTMYIYTLNSTPANVGIDDIVYYGTDGGISKLSNNSFTSINGDGLYLTQTYDLGVSKIGSKKAVASFDNALTVTTNSSIWTNDMIGNGDGYNSHYDNRSSFVNSTLMYAHQDAWKKYTHNSSLTSLGIMNGPNLSGTDLQRSYIYPSAIDGAIIYFGNRNMLASQPNAYDPWTRVTNNGTFPILGSTRNCRSIAIAKSNPLIKYYGAANTGTGIKIFCSYNFDALSGLYQWVDKTPNIFAISVNGHRLTDIEVDTKNENRVFVSFGGINTTGPGINRVWMSTNKGDAGTWSDMSNGLTDLPVICLVYQEGSDDIIYAGTDAGVYRWDKPLQCWVKFNGIDGGGTIPNIIISDLEIDYCKGTIVAGSYGRGIWESDLYMPNNLPGVSVTINASATWTGDKSIDGSILVRSPYTLTISGTSVAGSNNSNTNIYMPKYGKIYVEKGAKLIISGAKITNGCNTKWGGIEVFGNSSLDQQPLTGGAYNQGYVELNSNAILENAENAIVNAGGPIWNSPTAGVNTGGIILAFNAYFYNNKRTVEMLKYQQYSIIMGLLIEKPDQSQFVNCKFEINDNFTKGNVFTEHVKLNRVHRIQFSTCTFKNLQTTNFTATPPTNHGIGIFTQDASILVQNECKFEGFYKAINSGDYVWDHTIPIEITNSEFDKNELAIELHSIMYSTIKSNNFKIGEKQTPNPLNPYYSRGTLFDNSSFIKYCNNIHKKIYNIPAGATYNPYNVGLEIWNTGDINQNVDLNEFTDLKIGIDCDYVNGSTTLTHGINFRYNKHTGNTGYDFIFQANPVIRKTQNGLSPNAATSNSFSQIGGNVNWRHSLGTGANGPVFYRFDPTIPNQVLNASSFNVTPIPTSTTFQSIACNVNLPIDPVLATASDLAVLSSDFQSNEAEYQNNTTLFSQLIDGGNTYGVLEDIEQSTSTDALVIREQLLDMSPYVSQEVLRSTAQENILPQSILLEVLVANPDATHDESFINFLQYEIPNPMPQYMIGIIANSWTGQTLRSSLENNIVFYHEKMTSLRRDILSIYQSVPALYNPQDYLTWLQKVPTVRTTYEVIEELLARQAYTQAATLLQALPNTYHLSAFEIEEYNDYVTLFNFKKSIALAGTDISLLDNDKLAELEAIGDQTNLSFPRAMARSALCFYYNICYPDDIRLEPSFPSNRLKGANLVDNFKQQQIFVYPNPAKDFVVFMYNLRNMNKVENLSIADLLGKPVYSSKIEGKTGEHIWDTRTISNGTFIYRITTQSGENYSGKIQVQK